MNMKWKHRATIPVGVMALVLTLAPGWVTADEELPASLKAESEQAAADADAEEAQDALNKALDSTATQWSFQLAYQVMPDYHQDTLDNGQTRPAGMTDYLQARIVAPIPLKGFTILPRLTLRHYENAQGQSGLGNTELFGLIIPGFMDWGSGRAGAGPLVTFPGNKDVARDEWGYGFAAAAVNGSGPWFTACSSPRRGGASTPPRFLRASRTPTRSASHRS